MPEIIDKKTGERKEIKYRISSSQGVALICFALLMDIIAIILLLAFGSGIILNRFTAIVENGILLLWMMALGVPYSTNIWRFLIAWIAFIGEAIPVVGAFPLFTIGVVLIIVITRHEDRSGKDYSLLTLADPKNVVVRASRKQAVQQTTRATNPNVVRQARNRIGSESGNIARGSGGRYSSRTSGIGIDASGKAFDIKYSIDWKETGKKTFASAAKEGVFETTGKIAHKGASKIQRKRKEKKQEKKNKQKKRNEQYQDYDDDFLGYN